MSGLWQILVLFISAIVGGVGFNLMEKYRIFGVILFVVGLVSFCIILLELTG